MASKDSNPPSNPTDVAWYEPSLLPTQLSPATTELLEKYSHIPPHEITTHVAAIRDKAWSIFPYPCIGQWRFLDLSISQQPAYPRVLKLLKEDGHEDDSIANHDAQKQQPSSNGVKPAPKKKLLDLGCCFAQDIRRLIHDGAPADSLYACDLKPEFLDLGFDLFRDRESCRAHFFAADVLRDPNHNDSRGGGGGGDEASGTAADPLAQLAGDIDIIFTSSFFHLFSWDDQLRIAQKVVALLRPRSGSMVFGRQTGGVQAGEMERTVKPEPGAAPVWRHDVSSFARLWDVVGCRTGTKWGVWAEMYETGHTNKHWSGGGMRMMRFEVTRLG